MLTSIQGAEVICCTLYDPMEAAMANTEQRSNREKRKPKKEKPKSVPHISSLGASVKSAAAKKNG